MSVLEIIRQGYARFERSGERRTAVIEAAQRLLACRTAALGGHVQVCPNGHFERAWYNSCKHRFCPQCAFTSMERWLERQKARLVACEHFHVIFTMPDGLHALWGWNRRAMAGLLFGAVHDTLLALLGDPKYLGAQVGVIAALHTWGQTLIWHPHLHCLVTAGGLTADGEWVAVKNGYLLPVRAVRAVFARKVLEALRAGLRSGALAVPPGQRADRWERVLVKLGKRKWHVQIMERYAHGAGVATYLARYLRGGPMKDGRIVGFDGKTVRFSYLDNRATKTAGHKVRDTMELPVEPFLERLFQHVPEPNLKVVRHWGLYGPNKAAELDRCRELLGQAPVEEVEELSWQQCCERAGGNHPECCPVCGARLVAGPLRAPERGGRPGKLPDAEAA
jgi:hypothetical protein